MRRLGIRNRLLLVTVATVAVAVVGLLGAFNLILSHTLDANARDALRSRASASLALLEVGSGRVSVREAPDASAHDAGMWLFSGNRLLEHPPATPEVDAVARRLAGTPGGFADVSSADVRLYAVPVLANRRRVGTVVVATSLAPYEQTRSLALVSSLVLGGVLLVLVAFAARWLLASSLRPVVRMTRQAATWSDRDLDRRFALGEPHDELTELAATLDGLLDRVATSLRHEQRFSAELSHELRTPLARVLAETELALKRERGVEEYRRALEVIRGSAEQLARTVDALVAAARYEAGSRRGTADAYTVASEAAAACAGLAAERRLELAVERPAHPIRIGVERDLAERILQPVLENACRYAAGVVTVKIGRAGGAVSYSVSDDGPGVRDDERERIFEPGVRGAAANGDGSGLGLSLARRLAHTITGDVEAVAGAGGRFLVRLPAG
jgi:two-component system OmpR family sensor kinase